MYEDCIRKAYRTLIEEKGWSAGEVADRVLSIDVEFLANYLSERDPEFYGKLRKYHHDGLLKVAEVECDERCSIN
jgi:hypothetical protein